MVGQGWLADVHFLQQMAGALFASAKQLQNMNAVFIAERLEQQGRFSLVHGLPPVDCYGYDTAYI